MRTVTGLSLLELMKTYDDEELRARWLELMRSRREQVAEKERLASQLRHKSAPLDFMFMKLPQVGLDGMRVPQIEALQESLHDACGGAGSYREPIFPKALQDVMRPDPTGTRLPPMSAR
eukprot:CAMPEP_0170362386 /NCGR_PEP_ID=MMETSP0117_2-20130122/4305_1 /TAXON_ID=400756 /ORGANISM="Durinskia baltica, Strain CSIRO CS-38" /LENGTH=118 /DNA_ID=CAMNT_0010616801 /DNA_START=93 /DNA_END=449 /DNA_ORIENTATION=+